jgi:predicted dehydrogenase
VGFQALASPALPRLRQAMADGTLGAPVSIAVRGAWARDEAYFGRAAWVGRRRLDGRPVLDGALANPFAHAVMQVLAIADRPVTTVEVERYRTGAIEVDDTASLRLGFAGGLRALIAVTLCAEEFVAGDITVTGTAGEAELCYPTDRLRLPGDAVGREIPGRVGLLANLLDHRADPAVPLIAPLRRTRPFTTVVEAVTAAPVRRVDPAYLRTWHDLPHPRLVITGINAAVAQAAARLSLFSELSLPWTAEHPIHPTATPGRLP